MDSFITFGKFKCKYKYIFYSVISLLINDVAFGLNYHDVFTGVNLISLFGGDSNSFKQHLNIHLLLCYFGTVFFSIIFYKLEIMESNSVRTQSQICNANNSISHALHTIELLSMIFLWFIIERIAESIRNILKHIDFWMIELIFLTYFSKQYLQIEIYKHQKIAMLLTILPYSIKIMTIILSFLDKDNNKSQDDFLRQDGLLEIIYVVYWWLMPIGFIIDSLIEFMKAYIAINIKCHIDYRYISINKILMAYGLFGTIIYTTICSITTIIKCPTHNIYDYICITVNENGEKYFANFEEYYTFLSEKPFPKIITVFIGILGFFFYNFFSLIIIKNLTPIHFVFSFPLFYLIKKIILSISIIINKEFNLNSRSTFKIKFLLDIIADIICIFGYFIYLEVIKLNFCGLNYNLIDNIIIRGDNEQCPSEGLINDNETDIHSDYNSE